jgi:hypothetical protein
MPGSTSAFLQVCREETRSVSPTVFRDGPFRFFFFSREEERIHIHVTCPAGEAKFWLDPAIELARSHGLAEHDLARARRLVEERENVIRKAWTDHFDS